MEQVFAPWRIEWIRREDDGDDGTCPFCELPDQHADRENRIVARSEHAFVILNNAPYNPGHVMVIPYAHTGDYGDLSAAQLLDHARLKQRTLSALESAFDPAGFNTGLNLGDGAGGSIDDHFHTHVVPRWQGDTNFMPVVSDTKVIVEALEETYDHLHEAFAGQDGATVLDESDAVSLEFEVDLEDEDE
ncbi:HIT domain-containing protein [Halobacteria archaeon AArc-m2/3/4]|uniref:HIT domain-containing protein n=1 Tax=Natronoglomus mannanivorans TaxID=2979990 RepID=A0AAP2YWJ2_9EURY|nr:HIT domain-containing protein [Halobacteria archaeon AArc-xg1-1]MCU4972539.1 HIT domain-containing protein [Halobacteria archaeon AArc-m2/3/4]